MENNIRWAADAIAVAEEYFRGVSNYSEQGYSYDPQRLTESALEEELTRLAGEPIQVKGIQLSEETETKNVIFIGCALPNKYFGRYKVESDFTLIISNGEACIPGVSIYLSNKDGHPLKLEEYFDSLDKIIRRWKIDRDKSDGNCIVLNNNNYGNYLPSFSVSSIRKPVHSIEEFLTGLYLLMPQEDGKTPLDTIVEEVKNHLRKDGLISEQDSLVVNSLEATFSRHPSILFNIYLAPPLREVWHTAAGIEWEPRESLPVKVEFDPLPTQRGKGYLLKGIHLPERFSTVTYRDKE